MARILIDCFAIAYGTFRFQASIIATSPRVEQTVLGRMKMSMRLSRYVKVCWNCSVHNAIINKACVNCGVFLTDRDRHDLEATSRSAALESSEQQLDANSRKRVADG